MAREGRKMPAGTNAPNVTAVRRVLAKAVTRRRVMREALREVLVFGVRFEKEKMGGDVLAET